jgi:hypothetical protein
VVLIIGGVVFFVTRSGSDDEAGPRSNRPESTGGSRLAPGEFPSATTAGVPDGVELRPSPGLDITDDGTVIDGLDIADGVVVDAENVTIRNSRITATGDQGVKITSGTLLIEDSTIVGTSAACLEGIGFGGYEAVRVDISGCQDGLKANGDVVVRESYIHDLAQTVDSHNDGIQTMSGSGITIERNTICGQFRNSVSAVKMTPEMGAIDGVEIRDNLLFGGTYTLYMDSKPDTFGLVTNAAVEGNVIGAGSYQYGWRAVDSDPTQTFADNVEEAVDACGAAG